jgi:prepilin-type processing-associated H-X9-DG protein
MGQLEIQVLDSYRNVTYADGHVGAYYGINPPLALPVRPPGEWQVYDIVFRRPIYKDGQVLDPGYITVFLNGVLVQDHTPLEGSGGHMGRTKPGPFPAKGPLSLQDHGNSTRFRNIWYRELPLRPAEGGTDGWLTPEAAMAKRQETAAMLREQAAKLADPANPVPEMLGWFESLVYAPDAAAQARAEELATAYVAGLKSLAGGALSAKRDEVRQVRDVFRYLARFKYLAEAFPPKVAVEELIREQGWDQRRR